MIEDSVSVRLLTVDRVDEEARLRSGDKGAAGCCSCRLEEDHGNQLGIIRKRVKRLDVGERGREFE